MAGGEANDEKEYSHLPLTMGYYTRDDLPFYYAMADAFTVCDQNYCSVMNEHLAQPQLFLVRNHSR